MTPTNSALEIYQQVKPGTGTRRGMSWWEVTTSCGKRRALTHEHEQFVKDREAADSESEDLDYKARGTFFHGLKDFWFRGRVPDGTALDLGPVQDIEWAEAVRMFNFHREHFPKDYWGQYVGSEVPLPYNVAHTAAIVEFFGHDEVTGAVDAMFMMTAEDVARIEADRKIVLNGPGLYFIDWKTSKARKSAKAAEGAYTSKMQALAYPVLWNLMGGEECKGMIFDVLTAHVELRRHDVNPKSLSSVQTFFAPYRPENKLIVKGAIDLAWERRLAAKADAFSCFSGYRPCPFLGVHCGRY